MAVGLGPRQTVYSAAVPDSDSSVSSLALFATTAKAMEPLLHTELTELGAAAVKSTRAGVRFEGDLRLAYRVCLWSRLASRVLLRIAQFNADTVEALYSGVHAIDWSEHLTPAQTFAVDFTAVQSNFTHAQYAALKAKDAIVDRLREQFGSRPSVDVEHPDVRINIHAQRGELSVYIDLSGDSLHRRGYRAEGVLAPLKENLAAAILMRADWPQRARNGDALVDPMCGSGTLVIEAALMAADIAPGLARKYYGFFGWRGHDAALWQDLRAEALTRRETGLNNLPPIRGYDVDAAAIRAALANIERANLRGHVHVERRDLATCPPPLHTTRGLVVVNPPYGQRLGAKSELATLYGQLGTHIKECYTGWRAAVFIADVELGKALGIHATRMHRLYNGALECTLLHFDIETAAFYTEHRSARAVQRAQELAQSPGSAMFANRLRKNLKALKTWIRDTGIDCYRVYDADMPEYAVAIDLYHGDRRYVHVQEYEAPRTVDEDKARTRLREILAALPAVLEVTPDQIFLKTRRRQRGGGQYEKLGTQGAFIEVRESPARFLVNLSDYLDTGLFLDHRATRAWIGAHAKGARFLNLFCYTATATVHAVLGGATRSTSVDLSKTYLEWARRNFELNGIAGGAHELIHADVRAWLEQAPAREYDLIFLDPPTFSSSKRMDGTLDIQRDHVPLIRAALRLLRADGQLVFSTNHQRFKFDAAALTDLAIADMSAETIPRDFARNPHIHRCWIVRPR